ncbi:hypothetical protein BHM03_00043429, partial [Ensete ventricosum]
VIFLGSHSLCHPPPLDQLERKDFSLYRITVVPVVSPASSRWKQVGSPRGPVAGRLTDRKRTHPFGDPPNRSRRSCSVPPSAPNKISTRNRVHTIPCALSLRDSVTRLAQTSRFRHRTRRLLSALPFSRRLLANRFVRLFTPYFSFTHSFLPVSIEQIESQGVSEAVVLGGDKQICYTVVWSSDHHDVAYIVLDAISFYFADMVRKRRTELTGESSESQESSGRSGRAGPQRPHERAPAMQQQGRGAGRGWAQHGQQGHGFGSYYQGRGSGQPHGGSAPQQTRGPSPGYEGQGLAQPRGGIPHQQYGRRGSGSMTTGRVAGPSAAGPSRPPAPDLHQASSQASSSQQSEASSIQQQFQQLSVEGETASQAIQPVVPVAPSSKSLRFPLRPGKGSYGVKCVVKANHFFAERQRPFRVVIKLAARVDLHHLDMFLSGRQADAPQEALQVLDIVLRELPTSRRFITMLTMKILTLENLVSKSVRNLHQLRHVFYLHHGYVTGDQFCFSSPSSSFSLPRLIPSEIGCRRSKATVVTGRKQPQLAIPPSSGRSAYRSAGGPVHTAHTGRYDLKSLTLAYGTCIISSSIVVASQDWPEVTKYAGLVSAQLHRQELIQDLFKVWQDPQRGTVTGGMIKYVCGHFSAIED